MVAGLPSSAWLLIVVAVVPPLVMAVAFFLAHARSDDDADPTR